MRKKLYKSSKPFYLIFKTILIVIVFSGALQTVSFVRAVSTEIVDHSLYAQRAIVVAETALVAKIADSPEKQVRGLSGVRYIKPLEGLLFTYERSDFHGIWMKDMNFPIDVIWFDQYQNVIHIVENMHPDSYPKVYLPDSPSRYILEVKAGFVDKYDIKKGDFLQVL